ncbi:hypothetical protein IEQ34_022736 [Dendrobium chrysotoxum]|uniref:Uncharacterized protein n=1 Tax=Dendrobium chrysotoxum TaxID=161865 RepID=A0AAV7FXY3_DENCH|nr:hypothetical protein IEQ34_022736 [Dendrobium chrysotoxum]
MPALMRLAWEASEGGIDWLKLLLFRSNHMRFLQLPSSHGILPERELFPSWRIARFWRFPILAGMSPTSWLPERETQMSFEQSVRDSGMIPVRLLRLSTSISRLGFLEQRSPGISPDSLLAHMTMLTSFGNDHTCNGISPARSLKLRWMLWRLVQLPSSAGTEPEM